MYDVFGAIGSARHHKEGSGDQGPKGEADEFLPVGDDGQVGILELLPASCCQFLWLPPQATHSHHRVSLESSNEDLLLAAPRFRCVFLGISAKLVRKCEITENLCRCKKFLKKFANFCNARGMVRE
jgi:hypothetical protein